MAVTENLDNIQIPETNENVEYDVEYEYGYDDEDFDSVVDYNEFEENVNNEETDQASVCRR